MRVFTIAVVLLARSGIASAADWYVDQAAAAGGDGAQTSPFRAINDVKPVLRTGDTVWISDGVYEETVDFWHVKDGTGGTTTIRAVAGHAPIIDGGDGSGNFVIQAGETHNMTFQGLTVRNYRGTGFLFYKAHDGKVIDCKTENVDGAVSFYFANRGYVASSDLAGGVSGKETDGTILERNRIHHSEAEGISLHADSKNVKYLNNVVHDNHSVNIYIDSASNVTVDGNLVYMTSEPSDEITGILLADESYPNVTSPKLENITVTNNVVINNDHGIGFWDGHFPGESALKNVTIANNTVIDCRGIALVWDPGPHENTVVRNNIFANQQGVGFLLLNAKGIGGITLDHNLWHSPGLAEPFNWGGDTVHDHASWASTSGYGAGDVLADPAFAGAWDLTWESYRLTAGSPAEDQGVAIPGLAHDFEGHARPAGADYDIGAFERGSVPVGDGGGPVPDAGTSPVGDGAGPTPGSDDGSDGCSCGTRSHGPGAGLAFVAALALLGCLTRRRRR